MAAIYDSKVIIVDALVVTRLQSKYLDVYKL